MRVIQDGYANINDLDGNRLYTDIRYVRVEGDRIGVFPQKKATPPEAVFSLHDVTMERLRGCSSCRGDIHKQTLARLWEKQERATANAG